MEDFEEGHAKAGRRAWKAAVPLQLFMVQIEAYNDVLACFSTNPTANILKHRHHISAAEPHLKLHHANHDLQVLLRPGLYLLPCSSRLRWLDPFEGVA